MTFVLSVSMDSNVPNQPKKFTAPPKKTGGGAMAKVAVVVIAVIIIAAAGVELFEVTKKPSTTTTTSNQVTITVWGSGSAGGESTAFNQSVTAFETAYPNITVEDSPSVGIASTTYLTAAHAGTAPDVYRDTCENGAEALVAGVAQNLSPYLNQTYINSFTTGTISDWTYNGSLFGLPVNTNGVGLYYNKALVPNPPTNTYQMIMDAKNISDKGSPYIGLPYDLGADAGYRFAAWLPAFGASIFNSTLYPEVNTPQAIAAFSYVWNWTVKYGVDTTGLTGTIECDIFEAGHSAFFIDGPWAQSSLEKALGGNLGVVPLPYDNATGNWPAPIWGSVGYVISTPQASGITPAQTWASLKFIETMVDNQSQVNLFKLAGDFPSLKSAGSYITNHTFNDSLIGGWIAQEKHTQSDGNIPLLEYYYSNFVAAVSNLEQNSSTVTVADAANQLESAMVADLKENGYLPSVQGIPFELVMGVLGQNSHYQPVSYISSINENLYYAGITQIKYSHGFYFP